MTRLYTVFKQYSLMLAIAVIFISACKKDSDGPPKGGTRDELTKDSIFLYAQQTYLWNDVLPSYKGFSPRQYASPGAVVDALTRYKLNATGQPLDKYSFIDEGEISDEISGGISGDFGFFVGYNGSEDDLRITYVYAGSPAGNAGLERGDQIIRINGRTDLTYNQSNVNFILNALYSSSMTMSVIRRTDGTTRDVTVARATYSINPILASNVFSVGSKKVGYFALNSFLQIESAKDVPSAFGIQLDNLLNSFQSAGITELIVDLRYNGGGSVQTADYLSDRLVPAAKSGSVMHVDYFNKTMQEHKATILKNQPFFYEGRWYSYYDIPFDIESNKTMFEKKGSLNLSRVYFLVTTGTASASELVINSLRPPVMDVQVIGSGTYGKPVGFFAIHIDKYDLYIPQFQTVNQQGYGDYFDGLAVDKIDYDDISKAFGDPTERYLNYALAHSASGTYPASLARTSADSKTARMSAEQEREVNNKLGSRKFKGMIR